MSSTAPLSTGSALAISTAIPSRASTTPVPAVFTTPAAALPVAFHPQPGATAAPSSAPVALTGALVVPTGALAVPTGSLAAPTGTLAMPSGTLTALIGAPAALTSGSLAAPTGALAPSTGALAAPTGVSRSADRYFRSADRCSHSSAAHREQCPPSPQCLAVKGHLSWIRNNYMDSSGRISISLYKRVQR